MNYLEDDDDDIHFCLRCRRTILGLGAYVEHRSQKNCHLQTEENTSREPSSVTNSSNSIQELMKISENLGTETTKSVSDVEAGLKANDFFSLLELQSSSKTGGAAPVLDLATKEQKNSGLGVVTRSRRKGGGSRERKDEENAKKVVREKKKRKKKEKRGGRKRNKVEESEVCQVELLEGSVRSFSKEVDIFVENCAKEVNVNNTNILMNVDELDKSSEKVFELFSDFPSTSSPFPLEEVVPFTCDKTTLDDHEIAEYEEDEEEEVPPFRSYGGKWKPGSSPSVHQQRNESFASMSWTDQEANNSLLSAAGTSWRSEPHTSIDLEEKSTTVTQKQPSIPPPGHTRGKWLPSSSNDDPSTARRAGNRVQYWCGVCNRRLSSRRLYERHVASPLHTRRTRHERQLDEDYLQHRAVPVRDATTSRRVRRMPCKLQEAIAARMVVRGVRTTVKKDGKKSSKTIHCEVCDLQVARHQIGKHLVSRFHLRLAAAEPDAARRMTQSHATAVARQAPFRCSMCRFYCNTQESMLLHWASKMHADRDAEVPGRYWCAFCKHFSDTSSGMELHLRSEQHKDVISVVNRSFPIEIQKLVALKCETAGCERIFRYNSQLRMHSKLTGHLLSEGSASDSYQDRMRCSRCTFVANSERRLQKHMIVRHKSKNFFCSDCKMRFASKEEAVKHRRSEAHRYTALRRRKAPSQLARACPHCSEILGDVMQLKQHLTQSHPDEAHRCAKCGASFTLKQELSRHVRSGCQGLPQKSTTDDDVTMPSTSEASAGSEYCCTKCNFTSSSKSELLYHVALHHPITANEPGKDGSKVPKITCPTCSRLIRKDCLRKHLKTHTGEKRHVCKTCNAAFSRRDVLTKHCRVMHAELERCTVCDVICANAFSLRRHLQSHCKDREKNEHCAECGMAFYDK